MTRIVLTYEDYAALPVDGKRYELHEGELSVTRSLISHTSTRIACRS